METVVFINNKKLTRKRFDSEEAFENLLKRNSKLLFGEKSIYIDIKNKVESKSLGGTVPDGFLFDLKDPSNPEFYIVEVELAEHDFFGHIFPQITKFFAIYRNSESRDNLIDKLFNFIKNNEDIKREFRQLLKDRELYKTIRDAIENSQNILLIIDNNKNELEEIKEIYTDTWDKMVKVLIMNYYEDEDNKIFTLTPDFEEADLVEISQVEEEVEKYDEYYHLEGVSNEIKEVYNTLKEKILDLDPGLNFNPQKYYIAIRKTKNFAYIKIRRTKMHIVVGLPYEEGAELIKHHQIKELSESVQNFYGTKCFRVTIENKENFEEIIGLLQKAIK